MKFIDLTQPVTENMQVYPGDPQSTLKQIAFIEADGSNDFQVQTGMHVGTHIDAPFHMIQNGKKLHEYPVDHFFWKRALD